ncbi:hypothetical protein LL06_20850 [Hoeflea sp. BAL378]|uniref:hypothetical protein n=1 Tax=Hoeflea sp. BAL378 TaxID=1547437 RepID=UPI0005136043|nr:hypothetical protein [Hoeflea sp. BAL378]KGF67677.1 hypothetical protein LL06_20850 [Hoeflea sp. BAL378]
MTDMDRTNDQTDAFKQALEAIEAWDGQSVYHLERLAEDADTAFKSMPRESQESCCVGDFWDYQREIDVMIADAVEAAGQSNFGEAWARFEIPDHPTLAAIDAKGDTLYFSEEWTGGLVHVSDPLEPRGTEDAE